jgi:hypothetical protein
MEQLHAKLQTVTTSIAIPLQLRERATMSTTNKVNNATLLLRSTNEPGATIEQTKNYWTSSLVIEQAVVGVKLTSCLGRRSRPTHEAGVAPRSPLPIIARTYGRKLRIIRIDWYLHYGHTSKHYGCDSSDVQPGTIRRAPAECHQPPPTPNMAMPEISREHLDGI